VSDDQRPGEINKTEEAGRSHAYRSPWVDVIEKKLFQHLESLKLD
jgi:hypothetical protein